MAQQGPSTRANNIFPVESVRGRLCAEPPTGWLVSTRAAPRLAGKVKSSAWGPSPSKAPGGPCVRPPAMTGV